VGCCHGIIPGRRVQFRRAIVVIAGDVLIQLLPSAFSDRSGRRQVVGARARQGRILSTRSMKE
jgi:hypothetical protein